MSFDADEEILQDFLVEAGELLEQLSEQLVDLENKPDDVGLLNAIFRGFHTVKGGAGFLQLEPLVELCHVAENVFDCLRNGKLSVGSELMDVVLQALDNVNSMFSTVSGREMPDHADTSLLNALQKLVDQASGEQAETTAQPSPAPSETTASSQPDAVQSSDTEVVPDIPVPTDNKFEEFVDAISADPLDASSVKQEEATSGGSADKITDDEFDTLMDELHGSGKGPSSQSPSPTQASSDIGSSDAELFDTGSSPETATNSNNDEISEDEFDALLDELHGKGNGPGAGGNDNPDSSTNTVKASESQESQNESVTDTIEDDEFEALLDDLHGKGKGPSFDKAPAAEVEQGVPEQSSPALAPAAAVTPPAESAPAAPIKEPTPAPTPAPKAPVAKKGAAGKDAPPAEITVRVDTKRLDDIMNMVGELVLVRNRLVRLGLKSADEAMAKAVANLDVVTADLQTAVMKTRMQPIKKVFGRFPRVVRDLARNLKKEINLELKGEDTDLDKNLVEALADPLVHLVRNSVDHGIESPEVREKAGKIRSGKIILAAQQEGDHIVLSISDDGGGMDPDVLRKKAVDKGLMDEETAERLTDTDAFNLIFNPGFSTREQISDVSGRGVGMDVVKTKITQLNGTIDVQSVKGEGTVIAIKVPLTLAIMPTLMVMLQKQTFALPLVSVNEIFHLDLSQTNVVDGQEVVIVREKALPLFHLKRWLVSHTGDDLNTAHVVIVSVGTQKVGFVVDQLIGQEEVVIKPLGKMLHGTAGMAGATITGDGRIALILDVPSMLKRYVGQY